MITEALSTPDLSSDLARLAAISSVVLSRKPPDEKDIEWAKKVLARVFEGPQQP